MLLENINLCLHVAKMIFRSKVKRETDTTDKKADRFSRDATKPQVTNFLIFWTVHYFVVAF